MDSLLPVIVVVAVVVVRAALPIERQERVVDADELFEDAVYVVDDDRERA